MVAASVRVRSLCFGSVGFLDFALVRFLADAQNFVELFVVHILSLAASAAAEAVD